MKVARLAVTIALLLFVGATVATLIAQEVERSIASTLEESGSIALATEDAPIVLDQSALAEGEGPTSEEDIGDPTNASDRTSEPMFCIVDAVYFHNTHRCVTCLKIESEAKAIVEAAFASELADGRLRWSAIDMEKERQYVDRYNLASPTLILVRSIEDTTQEWVALNDTWTLIRSAPRFEMYIVDSLRAFLEECP